METDGPRKKKKNFTQSWINRGMCKSTHALTCLWSLWSVSYNPLWVQTVRMTDGIKDWWTDPDMTDEKNKQVSMQKQRSIWNHYINMYGRCIHNSLYMLLKYLHVSYYWKELDLIHYPKQSTLLQFIIVSPPPFHAGKNITTIHCKIERSINLYCTSNQLYTCKCYIIERLFSLCSELYHAWIMH